MMNLQNLKLDPIKARELWRSYQTHRAYQQPHDAEIAAIYKRIAQGRTVIRALASIYDAGLNAEGYPRLAIARADMTECYFHGRQGAALFSPDNSYWRRGNESRDKHLRVDWPGMLATYGSSVARSVVPLIPVHLRPKRGLQNYHILWEAEWTKSYPVDPYLLRRFCDDVWLLVAAWELTSVERAVMSSRFGA